ncbi:hypothetical protein [Lignipirellula cremea]|uniref:Uncharacterized protein n=1 Tax=Lignipirellula cremea TaxID=2528010 RepID=A0A518DNP5_9BACT|nr:hypothetical protein [Lignipirellula cremea]QDU93456.1 hypothetical protein Pla8534_12360 [Lignipirellula cremea]
MSENEKKMPAPAGPLQRTDQIEKMREFIERMGGWERAEEALESLRAIQEKRAA